MAAPQPALTAAVSASLAMLPAALAPLASIVQPPGSEASVPATAVLRYGSGDPGQLRTAVGAGEGVAVAMEQQTDGSAALEQLGRASNPRAVHHFAGGPAVPTVGTDARGRIVVVVRGCAGRDDEETSRERCPLSIVDLRSGRMRSLPHSEGAAVGDLDRGVATVAFTSARALPRFVRIPPGGPPSELASVGSAFRAYATARLGTTGTTLSVDQLDVRGDAVAFTGETGLSTGGASLLLRGTVEQGAATDWSVVAASTYGESGEGDRDFKAPQIVGDRTRAYLDGALGQGSYAGLWDARGRLVQRVPGKRYGNPHWLDSAGFAGDTLYAAIAAWHCGDEPGNDCAVLAGGPVPLG